MNPYAQGGWSNSLNPNAVSNSTWGTNPSVYGALPYPSPPSTTPTFLTFIFSSADGTILNSWVVGPHSRKYFQVNTDSTTSGYSVIQNSRLESVALIEWRSSPVVEIQEILSRRKASQFLTLSPNQTQRHMRARGRQFRWAPTDGYIELYNTSISSPQLFGRISQGQNGITLEVTTEAVQIGLLEACVVSAVLFMSGHSID
ncbi:hypothetical protein C8J57DRAFT_1066224 [Mycena rebaudengoi]|nr:hypothetical protein C8J57DRAFT_1066224 [Mycena rebaudengoi]